LDGAAGLLLALVAALTSGDLRFWTGIFAAFAVAPAIIYTYVVIIWHWKNRYRGKHSDLWGVLLVVETSGWCKIVYLFRHLIPDMRRRGRYN
jgi:hypothetical protein